MRLMRLLWVLLFVGCESHMNGCEGNGAERFAHVIDPNAACWNVRYGHADKEDYSICHVGDEDWLCTYNACRVIGQPVKFQRIR